MLNHHETNRQNDRSVLWRICCSLIPLVLFSFVLPLLFKFACTSFVSHISKLLILHITISIHSLTPTIQYYLTYLFPFPTSFVFLPFFSQFPLINSNDNTPNLHYNFYTSTLLLKLN